MWSISEWQKCSCWQSPGCNDHQLASETTFEMHYLLLHLWPKSYLIICSTLAFKRRLIRKKSFLSPFFFFHSEEILEQNTILLDRHLLWKKGEISIISWPLRLLTYALHLKVIEPEATPVASKFPQLTLPRPLTLSGRQYESGSAEGNPVPRVRHRTPARTSVSCAGGKRSVLRCCLGRGPSSEGHPSCFLTLRQTDTT